MTEQQRWGEKFGACCSFLPYGERTILQLDKALVTAAQHDSTRRILARAFARFLVRLLVLLLVRLLVLLLARLLGGLVGGLVVQRLQMFLLSERAVRVKMRLRRRMGITLSSHQDSLSPSGFL